MKTALVLSIVLLTLISEYAKAAIEFDTGGSYIIDYAANDGIHVTNGTKVTLANGGWVEYVSNGSYNLSEGSFIMTGGTVENSIVAVGGLPMHIYGGIIGGDILLDSPVDGGQEGDVYIYGSDFKIDGDPADYAVYHLRGQLTGRLSNGDLMDNYVNSTGGNDIILMPVPEPMTLTLLALGLVTISHKQASLFRQKSGTKARI